MDSKKFLKGLLKGLKFIIVLFIGIVVFSVILVLILDKFEESEDNTITSIESFQLVDGCYYTNNDIDYLSQTEDSAFGTSIYCYDSEAGFYVLRYANNQYYLDENSIYFFILDEEDNQKFKWDYMSDGTGSVECELTSDVTFKCTDTENIIYTDDIIYTYKDYDIDFENLDVYPTYTPITVDNCGTIIDITYEPLKSVYLTIFSVVTDDYNFAVWGDDAYAFIPKNIAELMELTGLSYTEYIEN